jgi:hypothetical protein
MLLVKNEIFRVNRLLSGRVVDDPTFVYLDALRILYELHDAGHTIIKEGGAYTPPESHGIQ